MKRRVLYLPVLFVMLAGSGCARHYVMKLSNGLQVTTASKPKLKGQMYYFKDATGQINKVPQARVLEIMPASMAKEEKERFKPSLK